jgi:hypothetical protein
MSFLQTDNVSLQGAEVVEKLTALHVITKAAAVESYNRQAW